MKLPGASCVPANESLLTLEGSIGLTLYNFNLHKHEPRYLLCFLLGEINKGDKFIHDRDMAWLDESDGNSIIRVLIYIFHLIYRFHGSLTNLGVLVNVKGLMIIMNYGHSL